MGASWMLSLHVLRLGALVLVLLAPRESGARPLEGTGEATLAPPRKRACVPGCILCMTTFCWSCSLLQAYLLIQLFTADLESSPYYFILQICHSAAYS